MGTNGTGATMHQDNWIGGGTAMQRYCLEKRFGVVLWKDEVLDCEAVWDQGKPPGYAGIWWHLSDADHETIEQIKGEGSGDTVSAITRRSQQQERCCGSA
eukprot:1158168-Pelagomonas_calceolata.AAC.10